MCACTIIQFAISKFLVSRAFMYEIESIHFNFHMLFYTCTGAAEETHVEDSVYKNQRLGLISASAGGYPSCPPYQLVQSIFCLSTSFAPIKITQ